MRLEECDRGSVIEYDNVKARSWSSVDGGGHGILFYVSWEASKGF